MLNVLFSIIKNIHMQVIEVEDRSFRFDPRVPKEQQPAYEAFKGIYKKYQLQQGHILALGI